MCVCVRARARVCVFSYLLIWFNYSFKTLNTNQNAQYPEEDSSLVECSRHVDSQSLRGLLDLEDEGTVLLKVGNWLLRHGVKPQKGK
jgi:hypothetical protein